MKLGTGIVNAMHAKLVATNHTSRLFEAVNAKIWQAIERGELSCKAMGHESLNDNQILFDLLNIWKGGGERYFPKAKQGEIENNIRESIDNVTSYLTNYGYACHVEKKQHILHGWYFEINISWEAP